MEIFIAIIIVVFGVLQIILFFKLWGMTNDVAQIKGMIQRKQLAENKNEVLNTEVGGLTTGMLVVDLKTEKQMSIKEIGENGYECTRGGMPVGIFASDEIMPLDEWVKQNVKK